MLGAQIYGPVGMLLGSFQIAPSIILCESERASTSVSREAADSAAKRARRDAGAYTEARATAAPRRRSGGELEFKLTTSTKARTASVEMSVRAARPPACLPARLCAER